MSGDAAEENDLAADSPSDLIEMLSILNCFEMGGRRLLLVGVIDGHWNGRCIGRGNESVIVVGVKGI